MCVCVCVCVRVARVCAADRYVKHESQHEQASLCAPNAAKRVQATKPQESALPLSATKTTNT